MRRSAADEDGRATVSEATQAGVVTHRVAIDVRLKRLRQRRRARIVRSLLVTMIWATGLIALSLLSAGVVVK
jgi:hypothetical protein